MDAKVRSLQYLQTWQRIVLIFLCFSINGLKEKAYNLNYYPILRRKVELCLFLSTHREWESFLCRFLQMLSTAVTIKVSVVYLQCSSPCELAGTYNFRKYLPSSFLYKLTSTYRQNWSCERIPKSQNSDKATSFSPVVVNIASSVQKVSYSKPLHNKSRCLINSDGQEISTIEWQELKNPFPSFFAHK